MPHRIVHRAGARGTVWAEAGDAGRCSASPATARICARRVRDFLKREAKRDLDAASRRYAAMLGVAVKRVSVRDQASRWGSCTAAGVLSYSWRLILAPPYVLDYLAAHEVAHLVEMNHSRALLARGRSASAPTGSARKAGSTRTATRCTATARMAGPRLPADILITAAAR